ncbi:MAG: helix-turn-helix domain-containing protein [Fusobacterium sp.]|uniref:helix-turn-helix domain-containing protein n=1 Tax=Fusobacterium sp. TaxID=68766 RepID=UPI003994C1C4
MKVNYKVLSKEMARQCLNPSDLAKISGLSASTINRLRLEGAETRGKTLGLVARALKLDIDVLIMAE